MKLNTDSFTDRHIVGTCSLQVEPVLLQMPLLVVPVLVALVNVTQVKYVTLTLYVNVTLLTDMKYQVATLQHVH